MVRPLIEHAADMGYESDIGEEMPDEECRLSTIIPPRIDIAVITTAALAAERQAQSRARSPSLHW